MQNRSNPLLRTALGVSLGLSLGAAASASDLNLTVESGGTQHVWVSPGDVVPYSVVGELSDSANQGLAFFAFDLSFEGGALAQADDPTTVNMLNFATPLGLNNPAGFGGTPVGGDLVQVGGGQNTINQQFAAAPSGLVILDVAQPGSPETLVSGSLTAPLATGDYVLSISNVHANVVKEFANGFPFWEVEAAGTGTVLELVVHVSDCPTPVVYCTGKTGSTGCVASIGWSGTPTLSGPDDFVLEVDDVLNKQFGLVFWGYSSNASPWLGGTLCVGGDLIRMPAKYTGGTGAVGSNCTGTIGQFFSQTTMVNRGLVPGDTLYAQAWYRDPAHPDGTGVAMSNALTFQICP